jgi:outer membrane protein TolC
MMNSAPALVPVVFLLPLLSYAQRPLDLREAVDLARKNYPSVRVSMAQIDAAAAGIRLARASYLPRLDSIAQANRATRNNLYGMLLQQQVISPISGPPVEEISGVSVFGTAVGVLLDWEPFDFGLRRSRVDLAESGRRRAEASAARTEFEAEAAAADAYLTILATQQTVRAAQAGVERTRIFLQAVEALVRAELRPGAEEALGRAELAAAQAQLIRSESAVAEAKALLAGLVGQPPDAWTVVAGNLLDLPPPGMDVRGELAQNPAAREQSAVVEEAKARARTLDNLWAPRFSVQATTYSRGTGARPDFTTLGGANGLAPNFYNWGIGFSVKFPLLDYAPVRAQQAQELANIRAEESRYQLVLTELETRRNQALVRLEAARKLADLAPDQFEAARAAESQAQARYKAGLATVLEVADTQRALAQAEIDNGLARLNVWRALLALRTAEGDLSAFVQAASR